MIRAFLARSNLITIAGLSFLVGMLLGAVVLGNGRNMVVCAVAILGVLLAATARNR